MMIGWKHYPDKKWLAERLAKKAAWIKHYEAKGCNPAKARNVVERNRKWRTWPPTITQQQGEAA